MGTAQAAWDQVCTIQYYFGAGLQRLISVKHKGLLKTQTLSLGGYEIRETTREGTGTLVEKEERSSFGNGSKVKRWTATNPNNPDIEYEYGVMDHLGSDSVTYNGQGQEQSQRGHLKPGETQKTERQSYDAWGARRNGETLAPAKGQLGESNPTEERVGSNLARGYTGHEMLDDVGLVHMNGRLYDAALGRMCGADPYVQTPENLQNYNRYSYVLNNPLSQIDPSGHFIIGLIVALVTAIVGIIAGVIATVVAFLAYLAAMAAQFVLTVVGLNGAAAAMGSMGASCLVAAKAGVALVSGLVTGSAFGGGLLAKMVGGAALSAIYNGAQTAINGGSFSDVLKSAAIGAATGAVGAAVGGLLAGIPGDVSGALGNAIGKTAAGIAGKIVHSAAHGVAGGLMSMAMGGTFQDGFIGSAIGAGVSHVTGALPFMKDLQGSGAVKVIARTAIASVSGGLASVLAGGKFANAAFSAAFFHVFNAEMHQFGKRSFVVDPTKFSYLADDGSIRNFQTLDDLVSFMAGKYVSHPNSGYTGECATGVQYLCGAFVGGEWRDVSSASEFWQEGDSLTTSKPVRGTMVATGWVNGRYPSRSAESYGATGGVTNHVGLYLGTQRNGDILVFAQNNRGGPFQIETHNPQGWNVVSASRAYDSSRSLSVISTTRDYPSTWPTGWKQNLNRR